MHNDSSLPPDTHTTPTPSADAPAGHHTNKTLETIKTDFPILMKQHHGKRLVYLDNAATTQKPRAVIDAISNYYETNNANVHRAIYSLSQEATDLYEDARTRIARLLHSTPSGVVFTKNATESLNICAHGLAHTLNEGDEIVLSMLEHHSNIIPWQRIAAARGARLRFIPINAQGHLNLQSVNEIITKRTKIVSITSCSNTLGTQVDTARIARIAHEHGAVMVVDAAQSAAHTPIDFRELGCDLLAASGHKMYGPMGSGILIGAADILELMQPLQSGGGMIRDVEETSATWLETPWKFEAGTPLVADVIGLCAAAEYLQSIGMEKIHTHEQKLTTHAINELSQIKGVHLHAIQDAKTHGPIISFTINGIHPHDAATVLDAHGICVRAGYHCTMPLIRAMGIPGTVRASFGVYNTAEDITALCDGIRHAQKVFA